jgi:alcohol dehydrogenase
MRYNFPTRLKEFAEIGCALGVASEGRDELSAARAGVEAVDALVDGLGLPRTLADLGLPSDRIDTVAELALGAQRLAENNPRPLDVAAMLAITRAAYEGDRSFPSAG